MRQPRLKSILPRAHARRHIKSDSNRALSAVIAPIVEGQVRSFLNDHPNMIDAKFREGELRAHVVLSLSKRIINDLLCAGNSARLASALAQKNGADECEASVLARADTAGEAGPSSLASPVKPRIRVQAMVRA